MAFLGGGGLFVISVVFFLRTWAMQGKLSGQEEVLAKWHDELEAWAENLQVYHAQLARDAERQHGR
jgi:hypothetical protein